MPLSILLLSFLLQSTLGHRTTRIRLDYDDILKIKCDALPYRTAFHDSNCYFVIDADFDIAQTAIQCSRVFKGAQLTGNGPADVYDSIFMEKSEFLRAGDSTGKAKKAMCIYDEKLEDLTGDKLSNQSSGGVAYELPLEYRHPLKMVKGKTIEVKFTWNGPSETNPAGRHYRCEAFWIDLHNAASIQFSAGWRFPSARQQCKNVLNFNTYHLGQWGTEEIVPNTLKLNQAYTIGIRANEDHFQIFEDKKEVGKYKYRLPIDSIDYIFVAMTGAGQIHYVDVGDSMVPSPTAMISEFPVCKQSMRNRDVCMQADSYNTFSTISGCKSLVVTGEAFEHSTPLQLASTPDGNIGPFIDLVLKNGDIALRMHIRFDKKEVALNSLKGSQWGTELRESIGSFKRSGFEVAFRAEKCGGFKISVNGFDYATFPHRMAPEDIALVRIYWMFNIGIDIRHYISKPAEKPKIAYELPIEYRHPLKMKKGQTIEVKFTWNGPSDANPPGRNHRCEGFWIDLHNAASIQFSAGWRFPSPKQNCENGLALGHFHGQWYMPGIVTGPLSQQEEHIVAIRAAEDHFQVFVNKKQVATYKYGLPLETIDSVFIATTGAAIIHSVDLGDSMVIPSPNAMVTEIPLCQPAEVTTGTCKHSESANSSFAIFGCKSLIITGQSFEQSMPVFLGSTLDGISGPYIQFVLKNGLIALCMHVRLDQGHVAFNSGGPSNWGTEQHESLAPFKRNVPFEIAFKIEKCGGYQIFVDGKYYATFVHRIDPVDIATVRIQSIFNMGIQIK